MSSRTQTRRSAPGLMFADGAAHLLQELARLDQVILRRIHLFRRDLQTNERVRSAPTYVSDQEVDGLLRLSSYSARQDETLARLEQSIIAQETLIEETLAASEQEGVFLPLPRLGRCFELSWLEMQTFIVCLAPELQRKYDRIYAYVQDDITRRRPSLDLALDLFFDDQPPRWQARALLDDSSALFRHHLIEVHHDPQSLSGSSGLAQFLQVDARILQFVLGNNRPDARLARLMKVIPAGAPAVAVDAGCQASISRLIESCVDGKQFTRRLLVHLYGPEGVGQRETVLAACRELDCPLLLVDGAALLQESQQDSSLLRRVCRESLLMQGPLLIENIDEWLGDAGAGRQQLKQLVETLNEYCWLTFTSAKQAWRADRLPRDIVLSNLHMELPDALRREQLWKQAFSDHNVSLPEDALRALASQYKLTTLQIAAASQHIAVTVRDKASAPPWSLLANACRGVSHHGLDELSVRVPARYRWDDLVLPGELTSLLQSVCGQVRRQRQVFDEWGFAGKLPYGRALSVLFSGSPGTGKTMAAQVMAEELQLELFKIDLSGVVSKYIGETEKNLGRVFTEAQTSNAILFFDEADALFGKRTEVSDAHDRYANIEVSYLLQKMEEYDGIVILATNFRSNMDDAFVRRIRFIIDFPFPDESSRLQIWRKSLPSQLPVAPDLDFEWLAAKIKIAGGNIKNVALNAAFGAAQEGSELGMRHMLSSCKHEFQKIGKLWDEKNMRHTDAGMRTE